MANVPVSFPFWMIATGLASHTSEEFDTLYNDLCHTSLIASSGRMFFSHFYDLLANEKVLSRLNAVPDKKS